MIKSENGLIEMSGTYEDLHGDLGCILQLFLEKVHIPVFGRELAKKRICEIVDIVLEQIDEEEE